MKTVNIRSFRVKVTQNNYGSRVVFALADFILLNISFIALNFMKRGTWKLTSEYFSLLLIFYGFWLLTSGLTRKFRLNHFQDYWDGLIKKIRSVIFLTYCISFVIVFTGLSIYSRIHIFGTCFLLLVFDIILYSIYYLGSDAEKFKQLNGEEGAGFPKPQISPSLLLFDFVLVSAAFFMMNLIKRGNFILYPEYEKALFLVYAIWLVAALITHKFNKNSFGNYYYAFAGYFKAIVIMGFTFSVVIFAFRLFYFSRLQIFGTLLLLLLFEGVVLYFYFLIKYRLDLTEDIESVEEVLDFLEQEELPLEDQTSSLSKATSSSFIRLLSQRYLKSLPQVNDLVERALDISKIKDSDIAIVNSSNINNIQALDNESARLLLNLYGINNIRWLNRYLLETHKRLKNGGYFISRANTVETHKELFFQKFPKYFAEVFYVFHFLFHRVLPKLPHLRKLYFAMTKGRRRVFSKAEVLGRLYFCGFKIVAEEEIENSLYFVAQKVKTPSLDKNPSYSPIIKLKRVGLNGQWIYVYKFRTMYPYSEYLQDFIYQQQKLQEGGKIKDDFRITDWGKFMRKHWLDELPMMYNWIRGELKFFGVRPLSRHYLNLYDTSLRQIRKKVKPGLIPPYYADLPKELSEINDSEKKYIQAYFEHPFRTQFVYFWKAMNNIILKGARSH